MATTAFPTYMIQSECGEKAIQAESIEAAKASYASEFSFDFDEAESIDGSWYRISDFSTGEIIEECN